MDTESEIIDEWNESIESKLNSSGHRNLVLVLRIAGILTILGAGYIIQDICKDEARRKTTKNKIIICMSSCDLLYAFFISVIGPAMVPKDTSIGIDVPGAMGNQLTCEVQGFVAQVTGSGSGLYNLSLALCYLLMVRYEYSDERLRMLESYFLYLPIISSLVVAIIGLPFGIFNFHGTYTCFIDASPLACDAAESPIECDHGEMYIYWLYSNSIIMIISGCAIIVCMVKMYTAVLRQERSGDRFRFSVVASRSSFIIGRATTPASSTMSRRASSIRHRRDLLSRTMRSQGLWYSGAFLFTFFPTAFCFLWQKESLQPFVLITLHLIGFTNAVIYIRPRFIKFRRHYQNVGVASSIWYTLVRKRPASSGGGGNIDTRSMVSSASPRVVLERLSSGMTSLMTGVKRWMTSDSDSLAFAEKDDGAVTSHQEGNHLDDEKCSVICECEKGQQRAKKVVDSKTSIH